MNRTVRRAIQKYDKGITSLVRKVTIRRLKAQNIDYVVDDDRIVSTRQKDVERVYNSTMLEILANMNRANGDFSLVKKLYD